MHIENCKILTTLSGICTCSSTITKLFD